MGSPGELAPRLVAKDPSRIRCVYCHDQVVELAVSCPECQAVLHPECGGVGRCPTLGCGAMLGTPHPLVRRRGLARALALPLAVGAGVGRSTRKVGERIARWPLGARLSLALALGGAPVFVGLSAVVLSHAAVESERVAGVELLERARAAVAARQGQPALLAIDEALAREPARVELWDLRSRAHELVGDLAAAISDLTQALGLSRDDAALWARRGWLRLTIKDNVGAAEDARESLARRPVAAAWSLRANLALMTGSYASAADDAHTAVRLDSKDARAWYVLARALEGTKELTPALGAYDAAVKLDPELEGLRLDRAWARLHAGKAADALVDATEVIAHEPRSAPAFMVRGAARLLLGDYVEAIADATQATQLDSSLAQAFQVRGTARMELKHPDAKGAIEDLDRAITLAPSNARAYYSRGLAHWELGHTQPAIEDLETFLDKDNDSPDAPRARWVLDRLRK